MRNLEDFKYVCEHISGLWPLPVRLYQKGERLFYRSMINFVKDPFELEREKAWEMKDEIGYYQSSSSYYYGILHLDDYRIVLGPSKNPAATKQNLRSLAFSLGIPPSATDDFISEMESLPSLSLLSLLQILCYADFSLTGKRVTLQSVAIHETNQDTLKTEMERGQVERTIEGMENQENRPYTAMDLENRLMDMVMRGDIAAIQRFASSAPAVEGGTLASDQLRQMKDTFIVTVTLVSRAAIRGGMDVTASLALSDAYIQKCELSKTPGEITELSYRLILDYAERVAQIRLGTNPSVLVIKVSNYIQQHLSEAIKVEDIAKAIFVGRSRLSTNFKKETGINLSDYILEVKINEAKRLLRYSNKPFSAISLYLGFSSQSHFTRVFKKLTEMTPLEYRQLHKRD